MVAAGQTERDPLVPTAPIPWSMDRLAAPVVLQSSREHSPRGMVGGAAARLPVGAVTAATETVARSGGLSDPPGPVAVSV